MADRQQIGRTLAIFRGSDSDAHTLPAALVAARDRFLEVDAACRHLAAPEVTEDEALRQAAATFADGGDLNLELVHAARRAHEEHLLAYRTHDQAREFVGDRLVDVAADAADDIVTEHLRPAQTAVLAEIGKAHAAYAAHGSTPGALLNAPAAARNAYAKMGDLIRRFQLIRATLTAVRVATGDAQDDHEGLFLAIRNTEVVWPTILGNRNMPGGQTPPWPTDDPRAYVLFLLGDDVEPWCPTVAEQDGRWREVFGERRADYTQQVRQAQAVAAMF